MNIDFFIKRIQKYTGIVLSSDKFTSTLNGYTLPPFSPDQKNRNHFDDRPEGSFTPIKSLVIHYTVANIVDTLNLFTKNSSEGRVSSNYVITESDQELGVLGGKVIRMAPDDEEAWHAGLSKWREFTNLNGRSLGVENVNKGLSDSGQEGRRWYPFDPAQIHSLGILSQAIIKKYDILPVYVVGHADIAPDRKQDPGILFPWETLYTNYGVGAWLVEEERNVDAINKKYNPEEPLPSTLNIEFLSTYLEKYGYNIQPTCNPEDEQFLKVLKAFKSHFSCNQQPEKYDSPPDANDMLWIWGLSAKYKIYKGV